MYYSYTARVNNFDCWMGGNSAAEGDMNRELNWPAWGAFKALLNAHKPVEILTDQQMTQGDFDGLAAIVIAPPPVALTPEQQTRIDEFVAGGGHVVRLDDDPPWWTPNEQGALGGALISDLEAHADPPSIDLVFDSPAGNFGAYHIVPYINRERHAVVVAFTNDLTWAYFNRDP